MKYFSTNYDFTTATLSEAVVKGLAPDGGLYMAEKIVQLDDSFFQNIDKMSFCEIANVVAQALFGEDIESDSLKKIVYETLEFETPTIKVAPNIYSLELFHGPTAAFKDVGARFMSRVLSYFMSKGAIKEGASKGDKVTVLVATSGDTGSAVANGFLGIEGIDVIVLYPKGKVSKVQEMQFTTLGRNITALEIDGTFDDCQRLVKSAFLDRDLRESMILTSANSINVARFLPQAFYYFNSFASLKREGVDGKIVFSVPSGNFGNLTAGLIAKRLGLPVERFVAANNINDIFLQYLKTGIYNKRTSVQTVANAMDVGDPSNFVRILSLYGGDIDAIRADISGFSYTDKQIKRAIKSTYKATSYTLDPHGACGMMALEASLKEGEVGVFLETAHPAKFMDTVSNAIGRDVEMPEQLKKFMSGTKQSIELSLYYKHFKEYLLSR